jgi:predicted site-specific integrase-resolvase
LEPPLFLVKEIYKQERSIMKQVIIYARVSTRDQNVEMQLIDLRQYAGARKLTIVKEYIDYASGTNSDRINYKKLASFLFYFHSLTRVYSGRSENKKSPFNKRDFFCIAERQGLLSAFPKGGLLNQKMP